MNKKQQLERVLEMQLSVHQVEAIKENWKAFYEEPELYAGGSMVNGIKRFLSEERRMKG